VLSPASTHHTRSAAVGCATLVRPFVGGSAWLSVTVASRGSAIARHERCILGHMGRPSKLTPRVHDRLVTLAGTGTPLNAAARYLGLDPGTVSRWLTAGRLACEASDVELTSGATEEELARLVGPGKQAVTRLYLDMRRAETQPALRATNASQSAITAGDWRAAKKYLVRRFPAYPRTSAQCPGPRTKDPVGGRPTKLNSQVHDELVRLVGAGNTLVDAANAAGINEHDGIGRYCEPNVWMLHRVQRR
jgi:hypothetical protein